MQYAVIDDYFTIEGAVFYHLKDRLDLEIIQSHRLNNGESQQQAKERWNTEQHWLAVWDCDKPFSGYRKNCVVGFKIDSSRFYLSMPHKDRKLKNVRNINCSRISFPSYGLTKS